MGQPPPLFLTMESCDYSESRKLPRPQLLHMMLAMSKGPKLKGGPKPKGLLPGFNWQGCEPKFLLFVLKSLKMWFRLDDQGWICAFDDPYASPFQ